MDFRNRNRTDSKAEHMSSEKGDTLQAGVGCI